MRESLILLLRDVRIALRSFRRSPLFTVAAVACLGLGIGANAAVFSFLYGIIIRPLPFEEPGRLCVLFETAPGFTRIGPSYPDFADWRNMSRSFDDIAIYDRTIGTISGLEGAERLDGARISWNLFDVLGIRPAQGRGFLGSEDEPGAPAAVLLSYNLWRSRFGSSPDLIGRNLILNGEPHTVIGVMPEGFHFPEQAEYWVPVRLSPASNRASRSFSAAVGRLNPGISIEDARTEMDAIALRLEELYPDSNEGSGVVVRALADDFLWGRRTPVLMFYGVVCFVLLLACANVANLMLTRASARRRETAVIVALGASRNRVAGQYLTESVLLALAGGVVGLGLGAVGRNVFLAVVPAQFPYYLRFDINLPVVLAVTGIAVLAGVLFGLVPVFDASRINLFEVLRDGGAAVSDSLRRTWIRSLLVVVEVTMALVVLIGAGLMMKSLLRLRGVEAGFDSRNLLTMEVELPREMEQQTDRAFSFFEDVRERVASLPDVIGASAVSNLPMGRSQWQGTVSVEGAGQQPPGEEPWAIGRSVQNGYFQTMGIPLLSGRAFDERDAAEGAPEVVIVNRSFAEKYWPDGECLGGRIKWGDPDSEWPWMEIVGVVGDVRHYGLDLPVELGYYRSFSQTVFSKMTLVARTRSDPMEVVDAVRGSIWGLDPDASIYDVRSMDRVIYDEHWEPVVYSRAFNIFSALALILAALGVYGVVACSVVQRTREFGIRLALGARAGDVVRLAVQRVALLTGMGLLSGLIVAFVVMRLISSMLFGVTSYDPAIYAFCAVLMTAVTLLAMWQPARRASRLDPVKVLRVE